MAPILFACPTCQKRLTAPVEMAGTTNICPGCHKQTTVPSPPHDHAQSSATRDRRPVPPTSRQVGEKKDNLVRNVAIAAGAVTLVIIGLLPVPDFVRDLLRDKWELDNRDRVTARLKEADSMEASDPLRAYRVYDDVLTEAKQHKVTDEGFSRALASAEKARSALYPKVQDKIRAEEAEKQRREAEEAKRVNEEKQRIAEQEERRQKAEADRKLAEAAAEQRRRELKEKAAKYKNASPQARSALNALKRIEARTEVGVNYANYSQVLGEQYAEIKIFLESPEGQQMPLFSSRISEAIEEYKKAKDNWQKSIEVRIEPGILLQMPWLRASKAIKAAEAVLVEPEKYLEGQP
jgi:hypothetical protein